MLNRLKKVFYKKKKKKDKATSTKTKAPLQPNKTRNLPKN
jgi:hypothetical protein